MNTNEQQQAQIIMSELRRVLGPEKSSGILVGEIKYEPGITGFFTRNGGWYFYQTDEHCTMCMTGPFDTKGIVVALATKLGVLDDDLDMEKEQWMIFIKNHFNSLSEIDEYIRSK